MSDGFSAHLQDFFSTKIQAGQNRLDFALRRILRAQVRSYQEFPEDKALLFTDKSEAQAVFKSLSQQYDLSSLIENSSCQRFLETLTYLAWLECFYQAAPLIFDRHFAGAAKLHWLDAGAKNWLYVAALHTFIQTKRFPSGDFQLDGVEIDPHRRYQDLTTRGQTARYLIKEIPEAAYHEGDLRRWRKKAHCISHFLPFVFQETHLAWGLPLPCFQPQALLTHLLSQLATPGLMLIVNQGEAEAEAQAQLLESATRLFPEKSFTIKSVGQLPTPFIQYQYARYGWLCWREA